MAGMNEVDSAELNGDDVVLIDPMDPISNPNYRQVRRRLMQRAVEEVTAVEITKTKDAYGPEWLVINKPSNLLD